RSGAGRLRYRRFEASAPSGHNAFEGALAELASVSAGKTAEFDERLTKCDRVAIVKQADDNLPPSLSSKRRARDENIKGRPRYLIPFAAETTQAGPSQPSRRINYPMI